MLYSSSARNFQGFLLVVHCSIFKIPFHSKAFFWAKPLLRDSLFIISHLFEFVKYFFQLFSNSFSMCPSSFLALGLFVSLGESFYIISYTTALVKPFFCFWITAQRHSIYCRILATGCTKDLRYQTFVTITLSFILPSLFIFALIHIYLSLIHISEPTRPY